jgi:hypothetical protein
MEGGWLTAQPPSRVRRRTGVKSLVGLACLVVAIAGCAPSSSALVTPGPPSSTRVFADGGTLVIRYGCERGPVQEPQDRICWGPAFSLYGDGTVIYRDATAAVTIVDEHDWIYPAYETALIPAVDAAAIVADVRRELDPLVEATAPPRRTPPILYPDPLWWDRFVLDVDGRPIDIAPGQGPVPPAGVEAPVGDTVRRLEAWTPPDGVTAAPYEPDRFCAWIAAAGPADRDWPWPDLAPSDFAPEPGSALRSHPLTPAQARLLDPDPVGGHKGAVVATPTGDDALWLAYRALMPDEDCSPSSF